MSCYKPLIRVEYQNVWKTGKDGHKYKKGVILKTEDYEKFKKVNTELVKIQRVPCGQCIGCRLDYSKEWATRCVLESKLYENNWFITLTYDDEHLYKPTEMINEETGQIYYEDKWKGCLKPEDLTLFLKRLRTNWKRRYNAENIRFFACGEYGEKEQRPHYHTILFNFPIDESKLEFMFYNEEHQPIYKYPELEEIWEKGLISVGKVSFSSCAYVARYITKKITGYESKDEYLKRGQIPEFVRMSRKPGIGREYYDLKKDEIYDLDYILNTTVRGNSLKCKPPRYFDKIREQEQPEEMEALKEKRKQNGIEAEKLKQSSTSLTIKNQLSIDEDYKIRKANSLKRAMV